MRAVQELSACVLSVTSKGDICCHICLSHRRPNTSYQQKAALKQRHQALIQFLVCHCCVLNTFIFQLKHKCWDTVCYWSQHTLAIMINFRYFPPLLYVPYHLHPSKQKTLVSGNYLVSMTAYACLFIT